MQKMQLTFGHLPGESESMLQPNSIVEKQHSCSKCDRSFDKPKLIQYYVCPHCMTKVEEEQKMGCQQWFGFLNQKARDEPMPNGCVECEKVVECMLNQNHNSADAVAARATYVTTEKDRKEAGFFHQKIRLSSIIRQGHAQPH